MTSNVPRPGALKEISQRRGSFVLAFFAFFFLTFTFLAVVDALPEPGKKDTAPALVPPAPEPGVPDAPVRVVAKNINLDVTISNPTSTDNDVLNKELLSGAVRYPTSAMLDVEGTVLLFGHSSYLPIVRNQSYKAFNGIQNLKKGDIISVYSASTEYRYAVTSVTLENASDGIVELDPVGQHLALVTCDSFGQKSDRFVLKADFVDSRAL